MRIQRSFIHSMLLAFALLPAASALGGAVITPTTATCGMSLWHQYAAPSLIDGAGLTQSGDISTWTQETILNGGTVYLNDPNYSQYINAGTAPWAPAKNDWLLFNLGSATNLVKIWLWQYNEGGGNNPGRGLSTFRVYGNTANDAGNEYSGPQQPGYFAIDGGSTLTLAQTPGNAPELGQAFRLTNAIGIKAVLIQVTGNYGDYYTGFSEVRFEAQALEVDNDSGALLVNAGLFAGLRGTLLADDAGGAQVWVYWGPTDGTNNKLSWATNYYFGTNTAPLPASFTNVAGPLELNSPYYYRYYASNGIGDAWATSTSNFMSQGGTVLLVK